jgi:hypothetical protein
MTLREHRFCLDYMFARLFEELANIRAVSNWIEPRIAHERLVTPESFVDDAAKLDSGAIVRSKAHERSRHVKNGFGVVKACRCGFGGGEAFLTLAFEQGAERREIRADSVLGGLALPPAEGRDCLPFPAERRKRKSLHVADVPERLGERTLVVALHPPGVMNARWHSWIERVRALVGRNRRVEQAAVPQRAPVPRRAPHRRAGASRARAAAASRRRRGRDRSRAARRSCGRSADPDSAPARAEMRPPRVIGTIALLPPMPRTCQSSVRIAPAAPMPVRSQGRRQWTRGRDRARRTSGWLRWRADSHEGRTRTRRRSSVCRTQNSHDRSFSPVRGNELQEGDRQRAP